MEENNLKRVRGEGCEEMSPESEGESSVKHQRLSEEMKMNSDEDDETPGSGFTDVSADVHKLEEEEDFEFVEATISDNWTAVMYKNGASEVWVVTKSPYLCDWIKGVLNSNIFNEYKSDGNNYKFEIAGNEKYMKSVSSCACLVFCFEDDQWDSATSEEVENLSDNYGLKNVIIVLSENTADLQPPVQCKFPVLNFSKLQVTWYGDNLKSYIGKIEDMKKQVQGSASWQIHKVGIFSRSAESDFEWLKMELESEYFRDAVEKVRPYYISNRGFQQFMTDVYNCSFGILYHTKNRGRINITDVTDSLYDEELEFMSRMLNKKVIVVVDDLQNGSDEEKSRIQHNQPSIKEKASDLFLFTTDEKKFLKPLVEMRNLIKGEDK